MAKYPDVTVQLTGVNGNVFNVISKVSNALREYADDATALSFIDEAFTCESYDDVLRLAMATVNVK